MDQSLRSIYRKALIAAKSYKDKNFREYFVRITKDDFRNKKSESDKSSELWLSRKIEELEALKRQATIQNMFFSEGFSVKR